MLVAFCATGFLHAYGKGVAADLLSPEQIYQQQCQKKQGTIDSLEKKLKGNITLEERARLLTQLASTSLNMPQEEKFVHRRLKVATALNDERAIKDCYLTLCRICNDKENLKGVKYWVNQMRKYSTSDYDSCMVIAQSYEISATYINDDVRGAWNLLQTLRKKVSDANSAFGKAVCSLLEAQIYSFVGNDEMAAKLVDDFLPVLSQSDDLSMVNTAFDAAALYCLVVGEVDTVLVRLGQWEKIMNNDKRASKEIRDEARWSIQLNHSMCGVFKDDWQKLRNSLRNIWDCGYVPTKNVLVQYVIMRCTINMLDGDVKRMEKDVAFLLSRKDHYHHQYLYMLARVYDENGRTKEGAQTLRKSVDVLRENFNKNLMREMDQYGQLSKQFSEETQMDDERLRDAKTLHVVLILILIESVMAIIFLVVILYRNKRKNKRLQALNADLQQKRKEVEQLNAHLVEAISEESQSNRKKNEFIANISHEIRTPLNAIVGFSEMLTAALDGDENSENLEYTSLIRTNSDLMPKLVDDIINKQSETGSDINLERVDVVPLCHQVQLSLSALLKDGVEMKFYCDEETVMLDTDRFRLQQLLTNLIGNAVKFTEKGYVLLSITADDQTVTFAVEDTGIGIEPGKEDTIFEKFERVESNVQGSGLGLYICKSISRHLGGNLYVDKTYHEGARFVFKHPMDLKAVFEGKEVTE